jgi:uncharacterized protein (TIGR02145 family)
MKKILILLLTSLFVSCKKEVNTEVKNNTISTKIESIDCINYYVSGVVKKGLETKNVLLTVNYKGGNGQNFKEQSISSTGVKGLIAVLESGKLNIGDGKLKYSLIGNPTSSGNAYFKIEIGGYSCDFSVFVEDSVQTDGFGNNLVDIDGNSYKTVIIGSQCWMAENLKTSKYNDSTIISKVENNLMWSSQTTGAWCYYNNDSLNFKLYGGLYNWYVLDSKSNGNKNVCPTGWHVPTTTEWKILIDYLGGEFVAGGKMKIVDKFGWDYPNISASNISFFSALPGGAHYYNGKFSSLGSGGNWWSSTDKYMLDAISFYIGNNSGSISQLNNNKKDGYSVRCIRD